jgi:hypothetical protein
VVGYEGTEELVLVSEEGCELKVAAENVEEFLKTEPVLNLLS